MKIPVVYLNFNVDASTSDYWDMALIKDIVNGDMWKAAQGYEFESHEYPFGKVKPMDGNGAVVILPARHNVKHVGEVQAFINQLEWCVLILCGDEEREFPFDTLNHPNMKVWLMQPTLTDEADFYIGSGYTPKTRGIVSRFKADYLMKPYDWSFSGQMNHERRRLASDVLIPMQDREDMKGLINMTDGFTQGLDSDQYYKMMTGSKAIPALSGVQSPDNFRLFEALEAGAVPVADDHSTMLIHEDGYWRKVFNGEDVPFKVFSDFANLEGYIGDVKREWPRLNNTVFGWWQKYKRRMVYTLNQHINELSHIPYPDNDLRHKITVIMVTSPIKSHPSTRIISQSINDIRALLPDCEIIIGVDGVRDEQKDYRERYEDYKKHLLWKCNYEWSNVVPILFESHMHQAAMTKQLLKLVHTPTILFVEHDTGLATDFEYDFNKMVKIIESGEAYTIRFHHEAVIPHEHDHMMIDNTVDHDGVPLLKTWQWSQRPHLSSTVFYRDMIDRFFTDESRTMIEDVVHGKVEEDFQNFGIMGWHKWRLWIYHPDGGNIKRSYTTDGRGDDPKYEMRF